LGPNTMSSGMAEVYLESSVPGVANRGRIFEGSEPRNPAATFDDRRDDAIQRCSGLGVKISTTLWRG